MTIKFIGHTIGDITAFKGFETSYQFMNVVACGYYISVSRENGTTIEERNLKSGDYLFDYETGTMWEVVE